jgi:hypothetical protein
LQFTDYNRHGKGNFLSGQIDTYEPVLTCISESGSSIVLFIFPKFVSFSGMKV